ncbi:hypothetical protein I7I48_03426 [Histoplasma ohiense]|nr:hypothetical protein I7I48_03426 [Histoplasma ohiense (nom. inval.)]
MNSLSLVRSQWFSHRVLTRSDSHFLFLLFFLSFFLSLFLSFFLSFVPGIVLSKPYSGIATTIGELNPYDISTSFDSLK